MLYEVVKYFVIFVFLSFLGWCGEELYALIIEKKKTNRGYLVGPLCPIYGFGAILLILILNIVPNNIFLIFVLSILLFALLEYFTSLFLEKVFRVKLWEYEKKDFKYTLHGRVALATLIPFGLIGTIGYTYIYPIIINVINSINIEALYTIALVILILGIIDFIYSTFIINKVSKEKINGDITDKKVTIVKKQLENTNDTVKKHIKKTNDRVKSQLQKTTNRIRKKN